MLSHNTHTYTHTTHTHTDTRHKPSHGLRPPKQRDMDTSLSLAAYFALMQQCSPSLANGHWASARQRMLLFAHHASQQQQQQQQQHQQQLSPAANLPASPVDFAFSPLPLPLPLQEAPLDLSKSAVSPVSSTGSSGKESCASSSSSSENSVSFRRDSTPLHHHFNNSHHRRHPLHQILQGTTVPDLSHLRHRSPLTILGDDLRLQGAQLASSKGSTGTSISNSIATSTPSSVSAVASATSNCPTPRSAESGEPVLMKKRTRTMLPCSFCGKAFDRPSLLKRHLRTHTGNYRYCYTNLPDCSLLRLTFHCMHLWSLLPLLQ